MEFMKKNLENNDKLYIKSIKEDLDLAINNEGIDRTHHMGNPRNAGKKPRPIILKLV